MILGGMLFAKNVPNSQQHLMALHSHLFYVYSNLTTCRCSGEKREKHISYIKQAKKQILIFTNVIKRIMNYYDTNIYYVMRKSHAFYRVQLSST